MRLKFWLLVMDLIAACGGFGSRVFLWAVGKASDATDWGPALGDEFRNAEEERNRHMALVNDFGESKVTVKKDELLSSVRKNRDGHRAEFEKAQAAYREAVIAELDKMVADARGGKAIRVAVQLVAPQDHTKDYDRVIRMLEMSTADEITVSEQQFSQFVLDEWGWMREFKASTSRYLG